MRFNLVAGRGSSAISARPRIKLYMCGGEKPISQYPLGLGYLLANTPGADITIVSKASELVGCDLIGLSSSAWGISEAVRILRSTRIPVMIGGQSTLWHGLEDFPFAHIVKGEGEPGLAAILAGERGKVVRRQPTDNIDTLAFPQRGNCGPTVPILSSRGCPFDCAFCSSREHWGKARFHSAEYFMEEVAFIEKEYPDSEELYVLDDLFIAHKRRFREIHDLWVCQQMHKRFALKSFVRSSLFDREIGMMMKEMGFRSVRFGAESASDRLLGIL